MNKNYNVLNELVQKTKELHRAIFDKGYDQGYKDGKNEASSNPPLSTLDVYNKGLEDAWDCAKKIVLTPLDNGIDGDILSLIFGEGIKTYKILKNFSAQEAIDKIKAWEEKQNVTNIDASEIKVGDEVKYVYNGRELGYGVVVGRAITGDEYCNIIFSNGAPQVCHEDSLQKTGRTFSQISEVLELLKGK